MSRRPEPVAEIPVRENVPHAEALALGRAALLPILPLLEKDDAGKPRALWTGSLRRRCATVNDIDCVLLPLPGKKPEIQRYLFNVSKRVRCRGEVMMSVFLGDAAGTGLIQLDVWFARSMNSDPADLFGACLPSNWGTLVLFSTGSEAHNIRIAAAAKERGWHWNQMTGLQIPSDDPDAPPRIVSQTEELIYEALGMEFIKPADR